MTGRRIGGGMLEDFRREMRPSLGEKKAFAAVWWGTMLSEGGGDELFLLDEAFGNACFVGSTSVDAELPLV